jgi:hypothetical protein
VNQIFGPTNDKEEFVFDNPMSVHRNTVPNYSQQDSTFLDLFISTDALHVSDGFSAHHQEHITVHTASGIVNCNDRFK